MDSHFPKCHKFLFIATENSISSEDCQHEIELARLNEKNIIVVLLDNITIQELHSLNIESNEIINFDK